MKLKFLAAATFAVALSAAPAFAEDLVFMLDNQSTEAVSEFYVSTLDSTAGERTSSARTCCPPARPRRVTISGADETCEFDFASSTRAARSSTSARSTSANLEATSPTHPRLTRRCVRSMRPPSGGSTSRRSPTPASEADSPPDQSPGSAGRSVGPPAGAANAEDGRVADRQRDDGRREIRFVLVLVQAHAGAWRVIVDEAGLWRKRIA